MTLGRRRSLNTALRTLIATAALSVLGATNVSAYVGESFLQVPGVAGGWQGDAHKDWVRVEAQYWEKPKGLFAAMLRNKMLFPAPAAPRKGASTLTIAVDKRSPALARLMDQCAKKTKIAEANYAESSVRARSLSGIGPRPDDVPEYYEYRLKDVVLSDCPIVADAPEQGFVVSFNDIQWLNYPSDGQGKDVTLQPAVLKPAKETGQTKSFVVTWIAVANDVSDNQCPVVNTKPTEADYFTMMSKEDAAKERAAMAASKTGVDYQNGQMDARGPHKMNICALPGLMRDTGHVPPVSKIARGLDLDGNDGNGVVPADTCKHKNYTSNDGRTGIDNQTFTVQGCMPGLQGHKGFYYQYSNEQRKNGLLSILVQVSGIDNDQNDDSVDVTILYSNDHMAKNASGTQVLPDYTFRVSDKPELSHYFARLHGKIVNGVVTTELAPQLQMMLGLDPELTLYHAGLRFAITPEGNLQGVLGGYQDWHRVMQLYSNSTAEGLYGFQCPALYQAIKRAADGLKDPTTGECNGISVAYDIEGVSAFIPPGQYKSLLAQADARNEKAR